MNIDDYQPASETEESSIPITYNPIWTHVRSISEQSLPDSPLSHTSEILSNLSDIELDSSQASDSLPNNIHTRSEFTTTLDPPSVLSDPSTYLSIPRIPIPQSAMSPSNYTAPTLALMPIRGTKNAPDTFKGDYRHVESFIDHYNRLLDHYHVTSERDKCHGLLEYCSQGVKDYIQTSPYFMAPDWSELQKDILNVYDAERMNNRVKPKDFYKFVEQSSLGQITNLTQWKKYHRKYISQAGILKSNRALDELQYHGYYWYGIPKSLRSILEVRLQARDPIFDNSQPWPITTVQNVAEGYFKRSKFTSQLPHLQSIGVEEDDEDSDSDDSDSDDSDDYDSDRKHRKYKAKKKKKKKKVKSKSKQELNPTQVRIEEPSRNIMAPSRNDEIPMDTLIDRLNTMSLKDPQYGKLYYQAVSQDKTGLVAQCISRKPIQINPTESSYPRDSPPHQYSNQAPQTYPRGILPRVPGMQNSYKCYGCFESGHSLRDCGKMAQMVNRGVVTLDPQTFKYRLSDGQPIFRNPDESILDTINRLRPNQPQGAVQYATIGKRVEQFYEEQAQRPYLQRSYSDSEDDDASEYENTYDSDSSDEEKEEYNEGHWTQKFEQRKKNPSYTATIEAYDEDDQDSYESYHRRCQEEQRRTENPTYAAFNDSDEEDRSYTAYPAERNDKGKSTRQARDAAMQNPVKRQVLDGVYMPPKRYTRSSENLKPVENIPVPTEHTAPARQSARINSLPKDKENVPTIPFREQFPVDAREVRFKDKPDIIMKEPERFSKPILEPQETKKNITLQEHSNRYKPPEDRHPESNTDRSRVSPRQSDLSTQVDSKEVVDEILKTQISLPLGKILGASKELSFNLQDIIRYKNPTIKPISNQIQSLQQSSRQL